MDFITIHSFIGPINSFTKLNFDQDTHFIYSFEKISKDEYYKELHFILLSQSPFV